MKWKRLLCMITALLLLWTATPANASADSRNIYVGDIITLEITSEKFSEEELRQKFADFEIIEIKRKPDRYLLSIRIFDTGERTVLLGDKEVVINVASTLNDIHRDDIFEGEAEILKAGIPFRWRVIFYIAASIFVLSGGFILVKYLKKRKTRTESPYQLFLRRSAALSEADDNYFVNLTFCFKEYLESLYKCRIIGKTSAEIVSELKEIPVLDAERSDIRTWLSECDILKFSGAEVSSDDKHRHYEGLLSLVEKIEMTPPEINEEKG